MTRYAGREQTLSTNSARVSELVGMAAQDMALVNGGEKIPLSDLKRIREAASAYLDKCAMSGTLPSVRGCAAAIGVTRQALYTAARRNPDGELSQWLEDFSDICGELTMQAALEGVVAAVPAIFTAKARYGWREPAAQVELGRIDPLGPDETNERLLEKYAMYANLDEE